MSEFNAHRFLPVFSLIDERYLPSEELINSWRKNIPKTKEIINYLTRSKFENDLCVYNGYAPYNFTLPLKFDYLFDFEKNEGEAVNCEVKHTFINTIVPGTYIEEGYKTTCILHFKNGIPERLRDLKQYEDSNFILRFILCAIEDKDIIVKSFRQRLDSGR